MFSCRLAMVIKQIPTQWRIIREIPENLNKLANELNERYLGQIALISPTRYMMDTDTVTGPLAVWWTPSDIRHLQTPATCPQLQHGHNRSPDTRVLRSKILSVLLLKLLMFYLNVKAFYLGKCYIRCHQIHVISPPTPTTCPQPSHGHHLSPDTWVLRSKILTVYILFLSRWWEFEGILPSMMETITQDSLTMHSGQEWLLRWGMAPTLHLHWNTQYKWCKKYKT